MVRALVCGFNDQQNKVFEKILFEHNVKVETMTDAALLSSQTPLKDYDILIVNLDILSMRNPQIYMDLNEEKNTLLGICSQKIFKEIGPSISSRFFDIIKKPISSFELKKKISEMMHVKRLSELTRISSTLLENFDEITSLYSLDDPYRVIEFLMSLIIEKLKASGVIFWLRGIESLDKFILAGAKGNVELEKEASSYSVKDILNAGKYRANELVEVSEKRVRNIRCFEGIMDFHGEKIGFFKIFFEEAKFDSFVPKFAQFILKIGSAALFNAFKLERARRSHLIETSTRIYNVSFFRDYLDKEIQKSRRFRRPLSLLMLSVENFSDIKRLKGEKLNENIQNILLSINNLIRSSDVICKLRDDRYAIILSETDYFGAIMLKKRIMRHIVESPFIKLDRDEKINVMIAESSYPRDGLDFGAVVDVCERRLEDYRLSPFSRLSLHLKSFWECLDEIYQSLSEIHDRYARIDPSENFFNYIKLLLLNEVYANKNSKGIAYIGSDELREDDPLLARFTLLKDLNTKFLMVTNSRLDDKRFAPINFLFANDSNLRNSSFLIYLGDRGAYCLFIKKREKDYVGFHSVDSYFIENLAVKLEELYAFEREFLT